MMEPAAPTHRCQSWCILAAPLCGLSNLKAGECEPRNYIRSLYLPLWKNSRHEKWMHEAQLVPRTCEATLSTHQFELVSCHRQQPESAARIPGREHAGRQHAQRRNRDTDPQQPGA
jgi:hypothetical protein